MKVYLSVQVALVALAVFCSVGCEGAATGEVICPDDKSFRKFESMNRDCGTSDSKTIRERLLEASTAEQRQAVLKRFCEEKPVINECFVKVRDLADHCLENRKDFRSFKLQTKLNTLLIDVACEDHASRLERIIEKVMAQDNSTQSIYSKCRSVLLNNAPYIVASSFEFGVKQYHMMKRVKECVTEYQTEHNVDFTDLFNAVNDITERIICEEVSSETHDEVLCKTIADRECSRINEGHSQDSLATVYADRAMDCYIAHTDKTNMKQLLDTANTEDEFRSLFKDLCGRSEATDLCHAEKNLLGKMCLTGRNWNIFQGISNIMELLHEIACHDEGVRLSTILPQLRVDNSTKEVALRCFNGAVAGLYHEGERLGEFRVVQYHVMKTYKNCLADYGTEHSQPLAEFATLLGEGLERFTCYDYKTDDEVLCNTIDHNLN